MMIRMTLMGSAFALLVGCGSKTETPAPAPAGEAPVATAPAKPVVEVKPLTLDTTLDIGAAVLAADPDDAGWKGLSIKAPAGSKIDTAGGSASVVITDNMSIGLGGERDIAEKKKAAQESGLQKFKRFLVDEPNAILWETDDANFLFVVNVKVGEERIKSCETSGYGTFTQQAAETLLGACKGLIVAP